MDAKTKYLEFWGYTLGTPEAEQAWKDKEAMTYRQSAYVMGDLQPYQSMVTGEWIEGRTAHRDHLKKHNVVEVGNDLDSARPKSSASPPGLKETLARVAYEKLRY